eukprot:3574976-Rhodomonas_salina.1
MYIRVGYSIWKNLGRGGRGREESLELSQKARRHYHDDLFEPWAPPKQKQKKDVKVKIEDPENEPQPPTPNLDLPTFVETQQWAGERGRDL